MGAISNRWDDLKYLLRPKTKIIYVRDFIEYLQQFFVKSERPVLVLDNHRAHQSKHIKNLAHDAGIELLFLPPMTSEWNFIERIWAYFKQTWRKKLYDPGNHITQFNFHQLVKQSLEEVKHHGNSLARGPLKELLNHLEKDEAK